MRQKSIQKYILRSNTIMVIVVMLSVFLIYGGAYMAYQIEHRSDYVKSQELSSDSYAVYQLIGQSSLATEAQRETLADQLAQQSFYLWITDEQGESVYRNMEGLSSGDYRQLHEYIEDDGQIHTFVMGGMTVMTKLYPELELELYAFNENNVSFVAPWERILRGVIYTVVILLSLLWCSVWSVHFS